LLPAGFDKMSAGPDIAVLGEAAADEGFRGGQHQIRYAVDLAGTRAVSSRGSAVISAGGLSLGEQPQILQRSPGAGALYGILRVSRGPIGGRAHKRQPDRNLLR
jgi:hypothetical protein